MAKILIVTKDVMEFNLYCPVVKLLKNFDHEVIIIAEGVSIQMWKNEGHEIYGGLPKDGDFDPNTKIRTDIDPEETLKKLKPDIVMNGLAIPINLGEKFGLTANYLKIKVGFVEDLWGVHCHSQATPTFICTPDEYGRDMIHSYYRPYIPHVHVTGSPAIDSLLQLQPDPVTEKIIRASGAKRVILIGGQDESTTPMLEGLIEVLKQISASKSRYHCLIIPRFHPKWTSDPSKKPYLDKWNELLSQIHEPHKVLRTDPLVNTRRLILSCTEIVSIYSNILVEAVALNRLSVSWNSKIGQNKMKASLNVETFPLCRLGTIKEIWEASNYINTVPLFKSGYYKYLVSEAKKVVRSDGKNTQRVVKTIMKYLD